MSTKFYIKDSNGKFFSENRNIRYSMLEGKMLDEYIASGECKSKNFFVFFDDLGNRIAIEGSKEIIEKYIVDVRHSRYLRTIKNELGCVVVSGDVPIRHLDNLTIFDTLVDESIRFDDALIESDLLERLRLAIALLEPEEYDLVYFLYLMDNPFSERELAFLTDTAQTTINYRKTKVIEKIKKFIDF